MNRRRFIENSLMMSALAPQLLKATPFVTQPKFFVFSKMFQWISDYNQLADTIASVGFNGIDLTVRPDGHVSPERVEDDLPKAVEACLKHKLDRPMMVTAILDANTQTERILKTAQSLGIKYYRMGWYNYDLKKNIQAQVETAAAKMKDLAALNKQYGLIGQYQNHSGNYLGAGIWDVQRILQQINSPNLGCQYDINHAAYEASGSWQTGFALIAPHITSIPLKDFIWINKNGKWIKEGCPLGEGMIDWKTYLALLKQHNINTPVTMHYEYPLGGAEDGAKKLSISTQDFMKTVRKDFELARQWWKV